MANHSEAFDKQSINQTLSTALTFWQATTHPQLQYQYQAEPLIIAITSNMASKLTPFLFRAAVRPAARTTRQQCRALSITACRRSDTLQVVRPSP